MPPPGLTISLVSYTLLSSIYLAACFLLIPTSMHLPAPLPMRRVGALEHHVQVAEDVIAQVLEAVRRVVRVLLVVAAVDDELVVAVDGVVELRGAWSLVRRAGVHEASEEGGRSGGGYLWWLLS